jgi:tRNA-2-methylthio-N6-dimethylallyladenosine synthase
MNVHDSERVVGLLEQAGYEITNDLEAADLVVVNTCSVRERAEDKLFNRLALLSANRTPDTKPVVAVMGCVAQQEGEKIFARAPGVDVVAGTQALRRLPVLVAKAELSRTKYLDINPHDDVSFPLGVAVRQDPVKAYITIIEGCNDFCSFCVVPYTRGHERMRPAKEIIEEAHQAADSGHVEIHLLGQIVNHYQAPDLAGCDFAKLLELVHDLPNVERIRFASPHPRHVTSRMLEAMRDLPKVCRHLHLPVQSGSTEILRAMRRRHTRADYLRLVEKIRKTIPDIALSTDMIVGFPGETHDQFEETISLTETVGYHSMFSFKYSERPNTLAAQRLPDSVPESEKTARIMELQAIQKSIQTSLNRRQVGQAVSVLVDSRSRRRHEELSGRTSQNTVVNFPGKPEWIGHVVEVSVSRSGPNSLSGEVLARDVHRSKPSESLASLSADLRTQQEDTQPC